MRRTINLKKGLNLRMTGGVDTPSEVSQVLPGSVAIVPDDFPGFRPKLDVAEGDSVCIGSPLMHDKEHPEIRLVSPVAGTVSHIVRGARRKIERVEITPTADGAGKSMKTPVSSSRKAIVNALAASGLWAMMRQRPYDIVPDTAVSPRDIFVTALDTAPLAADLELGVKDKINELKAGVKALASLTSGHIYIGIGAGSALPDIDGAEMVEFNRLHPAGNAGVQAANIAPVNKGEIIWVLDIVTLCKIGHLMLNGEYDPKVYVAVTGSEVKTPCIISTIAGAHLSDILTGNVDNDGRTHRIISGNVLTGIPVGADGYLRYPYRQVTVIPEGDDADEFMGWASLSPSKMSESRSFLGKLLGRRFNPDARLNGGRRAMIMSGIYDDYLPMDILPEYLIKAILAKDIDNMEALGIYEIAPEDIALAEYADPSKLELQRIVRQGLDYMRSEV
ncbi:MAG: Na(+)-translocating NADH-quinone reductase subunit A [Muribaculaceae bacterium]|nr:Na(+)-translocating NADH-quinone reductase subunit A [Muribaculaceae bacterium]